MSFYIPDADTPAPTSAVSLLNKSVKRVSYEQRTTVEEYEEVRGQHQDIAIEMPAGHGKTLVGGVIGEFNRLSQNWRVVYACATRQLAYQSSELLRSYGYQVVTLVGKTDNFDPMDLGKYQRAEAMVVTTYSHVFKRNPTFDDADQIIFDDAHAAEYAIQGYWGLTINRKEYTNQFMSLISTLGDSIADHLREKILYGTFDPATDGVDIIPQGLWWPKLSEIRSMLDVHTNDTALYFPWSRIRNHLQACQIYLSYNSITICPILPPNLTYPTFAHAKERIYMTATIGNGGELERTFGVRHMHRICKFDKLANKLSGRRLILFPEDHFKEGDFEASIINAIQMQPRVLCLCASDRDLLTMETFFKVLVPEYRIFKASDVEDSLVEFRSCEKGILLLSRRYEGLDLKENDCRLQIFVDLPVGNDLSDRFMQDRLKATESFNSLLLTRIIQGLGRCTRGKNDHVAVLFLGKRVGKYLYKNEFRSMLPAEIDAELELGIKQIPQVQTIERWNALLTDFFQQGEEWQRAEAYIQRTTEEKKNNRIENQFNTAFQNALKYEMDFLYHLMNEDYESAHRSADKVMKEYSAHTLLNGYRAWWNYLTACLYHLQNNSARARDYYQRSIKASTYKLWLDKRLLGEYSEEDYNYPEHVELQLTTMLDKLEPYIDQRPLFEMKWKKVIDGLSATEANSYEPAFRDWGSFLGYDAERPEGLGTPDGIWHLGSAWPVFEMKTGVENSAGDIAMDDIRQTAMHAEYVRQHKQVQEGDEIFTVLICPKRSVPNHAAHVTQNIWLVHPHEIAAAAQRTDSVIRETLDKWKSTNREAAKHTLAQLLHEQELISEKLHAMFRKLPLSDVIAQ
ncbi:helicase C-terminal domain-containing protein [Bacillus sp. FSL K6-6540]|uniref:helicase C-terminal domain-containing protein n=1 Tax=Bacillus sp. FSL K6-6540 TaxID=2921512 RepID=UPI0030FAF5F6